MVSSGVGPSKAIDRSVGGLVWVCRRNGSWWPGQILSQDELPEICLLTPRSGTPVKLLGRENASVDWYNLEKSKRIKAFRCGEYDDCIKKAMTSTPQISKRGVKYARKEDAILHALKLESALLGKDYSDVYTMSTEQDKEQQHVNESPSSSHSRDESQKVEHLNRSKDDPDSAPPLFQFGDSFEEQDHVVATTTVSKHKSSPNDSEDSGTKRVKRMRGLEDLGVDSVSSLIRKASQATNGHEIMKRKNRQRTLTKVLERSTVVSVMVTGEELSPTESAAPGVSDRKFSGLESNESKINNLADINKLDTAGVLSENVMPLNTSTHISDASKGSRPKENNIYSMTGIPENLSFECLFDVPLISEEIDSAGFPSYLSCASLNIQQVGAGAQSSQSSYLEGISFENEDYEYGCASSGTADTNDISQKVEKCMPYWQLKGKRNSRPRKIDINHKDEACVAPSINGKMCGSENLEFDQASTPLISESSKFHIKSRPLTEIEEFCGWNWKAPRRASLTGGSRTEIAVSGLYDVNVEVATSYRPQHVPYISLLSKVHGRPIIGHPVSVEVMDNGACDLLFSYSECNNSNSKLDSNLNNACQGVDIVHRWRTNGKKHNSLLARSGSGSRKESSRNWKSSLLSKKIRKLSSLTGSSRLSQAEKQQLVEKITDPAIACIPLKIVFSRINAALNSSMRLPAHLAET